jgi:hypothetical protein
MKLKKKNQEDQTLWFKLSEWVMEHVIIFVFIYIQLQQCYVTVILMT